MRKNCKEPGDELKSFSRASTRSINLISIEAKIISHSYQRYPDHGTKVKSLQENYFDENIILAGCEEEMHEIGSHLPWVTANDNADWNSFCIRSKYLKL
jgi:hypothetical protein